MSALEAHTKVVKQDQVTVKNEIKAVMQRCQRIGIAGGIGVIAERGFDEVVRTEKTRSQGRSECTIS